MNWIKQWYSSRNIVQSKRSRRNTEMRKNGQRFGSLTLSSESKDLSNRKPKRPDLSCSSYHSYIFVASANGTEVLNILKGCVLLLYLSMHRKDSTHGDYGRCHRFHDLIPYAAVKVGLALVNPTLYVDRHASVSHCPY